MLKTNIYMPLLAIIVSVLAVLSGTASAHATSIYDNVYRTTDTVVLARGNHSNGLTDCSPVDYTTSYVGLFTKSGLNFHGNGYSWASSATSARDDYMNAVNGGGSWGVSQYRAYNINTADYTGVGYDDQITLFWVQAPDKLKFSWSSTSLGSPPQDYGAVATSTVSTIGANVRSMTFYLSGGNYDCNSTDASAGNTTNVSTTPAQRYSGTDVRNLFSYNADTATPADYAGVTPPDNVVPRTNSPSKPNWYISAIVNNKGNFHDSNFNTFDTVPFTCDGGLAPIITWSIIRHSPSGDVTITSGVQSPTAQIDYDFGKADTDRNYTIKGIYDCGSTDPLNFTQYGTADFTINKVGSLAVNLFDACVDANFPFIHPDGCLNNLYSLINLMAFGEVKLPSFTFNPACHNLTTLNGWLHLPNGYQVCPAIPSTVRAITTPFVAFMLGLITFGWLQKRNIGDF